MTDHHKRAWASSRDWFVRATLDLEKFHHGKPTYVELCGQQISSTVELYWLSDVRRRYRHTHRANMHKQPTVVANDGGRGHVLATFDNDRHLLTTLNVQFYVYSTIGNCAWWRRAVIDVSWYLLKHDVATTVAYITSSTYKLRFMHFPVCLRWLMDVCRCLWIAFYIQSFVSWQHWHPQTTSDCVRVDVGYNVHFRLGQKAVIEGHGCGLNFQIS